MTPKVFNCVPEFPMCRFLNTSISEENVSVCFYNIYSRNKIRDRFLQKLQRNERRNLIFKNSGVQEMTEKELIAL